jgi:hypothetical protein
MLLEEWRVEVKREEREEGKGWAEELVAQAAEARVFGCFVLCCNMLMLQVGEAVKVRSVGDAMMAREDDARKRTPLYRLAVRT